MVDRVIRRGSRKELVRDTEISLGVASEVRNGVELLLASSQSNSIFDLISMLNI